MALSGTSKPGGVMLISSAPRSDGRDDVFAASVSAITDFSVSGTSSPKPYQPLPFVTARRYAGAVRPPTTTGIDACTGRGIACTPSNDTYGPRWTGCFCVQ